MSDEKDKSRKKPERGLGRGLSALMQDVSVSEVVARSQPVEKTQDKQTEPVSNVAQKGVSTIAIDRLERNPDQPRRYFDPEKLEELTQSIKDKGVLQPILVRPLPERAGASQGEYQIVAGERRYQAALAAGLSAMPVLIRELSDQDVLEIGVVENVQRADLNPIEEAQAYKALIDQFGRTQGEIAQAIGKSRPHIANMLRLLNLPKLAQDYLQEGKITTGHARAIIAAPDPAALAEDIAIKGLSVRAAEDWVRRLKQDGLAKARPKEPKDADTKRVEQSLMDVLGLKIDLRHKRPGGELRIKYKTLRQLDDLIKKLGG